MTMYLPALASGSTGLTVATSNVSNFRRGAAGCASTPETKVPRAAIATCRIIKLLTHFPTHFQDRKRIRLHRNSQHQENSSHELSPRSRNHTLQKSSACKPEKTAPAQYRRLDKGRR